MRTKWNICLGLVCLVFLACEQLGQNLGDPNTKVVEPEKFDDVPAVPERGFSSAAKMGFGIGAAALGTAVIGGTGYVAKKAIEKTKLYQRAKIKKFYSQNQEKWRRFLLGDKTVTVVPEYDHGRIANLKQLVIVEPYYGDKLGEYRVSKAKKEEIERAKTPASEMELDRRRYLIANFQRGDFESKGLSEGTKNQVLGPIWVGGQNSVDESFKKVISAKWHGVVRDEHGKVPPFNSDKYNCDLPTNPYDFWTKELKEICLKRGTTWAIYDVPDHAEAMDLWMGQYPDGPTQTILEVYFDMMDQAWRNNQPILVHCQVGQSRSASIVIAYMMYRFGVTFEEALVYLKKSRLSIAPAEGLHHKLKTFEAEILNKEIPPAHWHNVWHNL